MKGVIYEMEILDNHGIVHKTRQGFWNGSIINEPASQDLKPVRKLFPHVPEELFEPLPAKPIDVLVGLIIFDYILMEEKVEIVSRVSKHSILSSLRDGQDTTRTLRSSLRVC